MTAVRLGLFALYGAVACGEDPGFGQLNTELTFSPGTVDFGARELEGLAQEAVSLRYTGRAPLRVNAVRFDPPISFVEVMPADGGSLLGLRLVSGTTVPLRVLYAPDEAGRHDTLLTLSTTEGDSQLQVRAQTLGPAAESLRISPSRLELDPVFLGEAVPIQLSVENRSERTARLTDVEASSARWSWVAPDPSDRPASTLQPNAVLTVDGRWSPSGLGRVTDELQLAFGSELRLPVPVTAQVYPAGTLSCPSEVDLGSVVRGTKVVRSLECTLQGGGATVLPITDGAVQVRSLPWTGGDQLILEVTAEGQGLPEARVRDLPVMTRDGQQQSLRVRYQVEPPPDSETELRGVLTWTDRFSDLDLHFVRNGRSPFSIQDDCYFFQRNPGWGDPDTRFDDPFLDRDSTSGARPEMVTLEAPAEDRYDMYVFHHGFDPVVGNRPVEFQVRVSSFGSELQTVEGQTAGCGQIFHAGTVHRDGPHWKFEVRSEANFDFEEFAESGCP